VRRLLTLILILCLAAPARPGSQTVVLVVAADSPVKQLDSIDVRKLFLGWPVLPKGSNSPLHPLRNRGDTSCTAQRTKGEPSKDCLLDEIFLQQIVRMTAESYDRQMLKRVNQGGLRPTEFTSVSELISALSTDPGAVSFMWERDVGHNPHIRVIRVLWSD
jgi:hypothetical protein